MNLSLWTLAIVLLLIAFRLVVGLRLAIWQIMLGGALTVLVCRAITLTQAWRAIDWEVIGFLFGVFTLGQALVSSGLLYRSSTRLLGKVGNAELLVLTVLLGSGLASALLMNDTVAVIGTPLMLTLARVHRLPSVLLLLALAFGVTIGSVMSPIGNPQNLLIAIHGGVSNPFWTFFKCLTLPTLLNLFLAWGTLRIAFWRDFHGQALLHSVPELDDKHLARLAAQGVICMTAIICLKIVLAILPTPMELPLWIVAVGACAPILIRSPRRMEVVRHIDWHTLIFFVALFVLMQSVWDSGAIQSWLPPINSSFASVPHLLVGSVLLSQLVSNVPLVALALPLVQSASSHSEAMLALAAGSTIAGNLTLIGAASNIIIAQAAERKGEHLGFWIFLAVGAPLTLVNLLVYWLFL
ncbi:anion transporter [Sideroxydans sp. CL21]|uniref:anion transporter n=1 Tax=Sideroxydans sp. CL21 TaxID=2600596 RepID=UPI0024BC3DF6|nr:anion transporter [Sideroxydans sp. CL21]